MRVQWKHAGIAAIALAAAAAVRWLLDPYLQFRLPYASFVLAIVFVAWRTSTAFAIATCIASCFVANYLFVPPRFSIAIPFMSGADWVGTVAYVVVSASIILMADRMRRAQEESALSGHQLELISNRLPALVSYVGSDLRYRWCNDEYTRWFGLTREQLVGKTVEDVLGADTWRVVQPNIQAALAGSFVEYETEARYAHGGTRWIHVVYTPHYAVDESVQGVVAMVTDISARKRTERNAFLLAELNSAFALLPSAVDAARQVTARLVERLGLSRCLLAEIDDDMDTVRVFHQHSREPEQSQAVTYRVSDFLTETERRQLADGKPLVIKDVRADRSMEAAANFLALGIGAVVSAPYVSEGKRKFALAAEKDMPYEWQDDEVELLREVAARFYVELDRARAEEHLRESERRYRLLATVITDIPCAVDRVGRFVTPQKSWMAYTGQSFAQSRDFGWFDAVHPDDRERARLAWVESLRSRWPYEVRVRIWHAASRTYRHIVARAVPLTDETGEVREWVGACTDIHEEAERAQTLLEADRRKDEFLATLAHELRNPLAPILNGLYILRLRGKTEGALASVYQMLDRQVKHLVRLVDDLLEVSRITRGRVELRKERTTLQWIIDNAIETSRPSIDEAGHHLEVNVPAEPLALEADPIRLAQVLTNLLNNAAKYTDRNGQILVTARRDGGDAVVTVRDNGRGIAADMLPRIFDLFTQASSGRAHPHGGLGIGLTLVRSLVELHAGTVTAHSAGLLRGSEFTVRLPLQASPADRVEPTPVAREPSLTRRILVVDDNRDAADSLGVVLALHGMEARTAHDGYAALEALDEFRPSVILLDLGLPGIDGYEVAQRVRQHPHGRHATIIALTGWGQERDRRRSADVGMDHHLVKPVDIEALRQLLATLPAEPAAA